MVRSGVLAALLAACATASSGSSGSLHTHDIDVIGSSTVYGVGATVPFPAALEAQLGDPWTVHNSGVPGDTAEGCLLRWRYTTRAALYGNLVVMCGLNNVAQGGAAADAALALTTMMDEAQSEGLRVVAVLLQPVTGFTPSQREQLQLLNAALSDYCTVHQIACVDVYSALDDGTGAMRPEYDFDGLHPNQAGADVIASLVRLAFP